MDTISVQFRPSAGEKTGGAVYYQITHLRKVRLLHPGHRLTAAEWAASRLKTANSGRLLRVMGWISRDLDRLRRIMSYLNRSPTGYSVEDVISEFNRIDRDLELTAFAGHIVARFCQQDKKRTAETYLATMASFNKFWSAKGEERELRLDYLTADIVDEYNDWLARRGVVSNTISFYNRILRAIYNRALDKEEIMADRRPFRRAYTGVDKTVKRALPFDVISRIASLRLSEKPALDYARDIFILSFCLRGMSFVDMAFLRKTDLRNGRLVYCRRKTGQRLEIEWTEQMRRILDKYPKNGSNYLLPIIRQAGCDERRAYRCAAYNINRALKRVGRMAGLSIPLTMYVARHSWASAALKKGVPMGVISEGMGHDSERTTRIYLAQLDTSAVDRANAMILGSLYAMRR